MRYVLDSSVAFKWGLKEHLSDRAEKLRDEFRRGMHELLAPDVLPIEVGHAFTRAERQNRISQSQSLALWADIMTTRPQLVPSLPLMPRAMILSSQARIGVYDCLYVALAEQEQCGLVTADQRLLNAFQGHVSIIALSTLP
jgi:predicted nucleic acid-binding protein